MQINQAMTNDGFVSNVGAVGDYMALTKTSQDEVHLILERNERSSDQ